MDPETAAAALAAFDTTPTTHHDDGDGDGEPDGLADGDRARAARRRADVDIFGDLCRQRLTHHHPAGADSDVTDATSTSTGDGGDTTDPADSAADNDVAAGPHAAGTSAGGGSCARCGAAPSTARPAFLVVADLAALDPDAPVGSGTARLHWATSRAPVELTPAAARRLACDATLRVVVTDGARVLGVTAAHPKVSASLRAALVVRDGGCRFPGCTQPAERCDAHHIIPVAANGPTTLQNLALVCRDHHHAIHDSRWHATPYPALTPRPRRQPMRRHR